jgi:putative ABC transport system permease protein
MGLASTLCRRSLTQRPGRTLFSVLGIAVGIATVVGVFTLDHNTIAGLRLPHDEHWRPELEVRPAPGIADPRGKLRATEGVAGAAAFFQNRVEVHVGEAERAGAPFSALCIAAEAESLPSLDAYQLAAGAHIDPTAERPQALVGMAVARELNLRPGDEITLARPRRAARKACVDGVMQEVSPAVRDAPLHFAFEIVGVLAREKLGRRADGEVVLIDLARGEEVFADARVDSRFWVRPDPLVDLERLRANLSGNFAYDIGRSVVIGQAADERAFRNGVRMAGLLALVLGLYVIFHTLSMSIIERVREVGTLHALGAARGQIARVFLLEALTLAALGGAAGLAGGLGMARALLLSGLTTLGSGRVIDLFEVPWPVVLPLVGLGMGLAVLGAVFPLLRARNASTVEALRGEQALAQGGEQRGFQLFAALLLGGLLPALYYVIVPVVGEASRVLVGSVLLAVGVLGLLVAVPLLVPTLVSGLCRLLERPLRAISPFAGAMAARSMLTNPRRVAVSTAAIALVAAAFVGLKGMTASLRGEIQLWADAAVTDKVFVHGLPQVNYTELSEKLRSYPGVRAVESGSAHTYAPFLLVGLRLEQIDSYGPLAEDPRLIEELRERHGLILSERVARNFGYAVGDAVQVPTGAGGAQEFRVVAISDEYGYFPFPDERMYGVVSDRHMKRYFCMDTDTTDRVSVLLEEGADAGVVAAAVGDFLGGEASFQTVSGARLRDLQVADIDSDFMLFDLILALTALLAGVGVLNGQLLAALERTKELGILKALGTSAGQIAGMVWIESAVMGAFGGCIGVGLGSLLGPVIVTALEQLSGLVLPHRGAGPWVWITLVAAVVLALIAALYPVWRMNRTDAVRAVRTG